MSTRRRPGHCSQPSLNHIFNNISDEGQSGPPPVVESSCQPPTRPPVPLFTSNTMDQVSLHVHQSSKMDTDFSLNDGLPIVTGGDWRQLDSPQFVHSTVTIMPSSNSAVNSASVSERTVSPKDLLLSAPPSTAFTNLTSPSIQDSPFDALDNYETSPLFPVDDPITGNSNFPLFPDAANDIIITDCLSRAISIETFDGTSIMDSPSPLVIGDAGRKRSTESSLQLATTHSSVSGVKSRRRNRPLAPIKFDPSDKISMKRARNTESARQSRQRRYEWEAKMKEELASRDAEIQELEKEKEHWRKIALSLGYSNTST